MIKKIAFTHYQVSDMNRASDFYENILGLNPLFRGEEWAEYELDGQRLAVYKTNKPPSGSGGAVVSFHADPIEEVIRELKNRGVRFAQDLQSYPYGKLASFYDPDENLLGLYEPQKKPLKNG